MRAILVGIKTKNDRYNIKDSLDELENLAKSLDIEVVDKLWQNLDFMDKKTYIGSGKVQQLALSVIINSIDLVILNDEVSAKTLANIKDILKIEVIDRSYLILQIFFKRANSKEAKLQVQLAKNIYMLPRVNVLSGNSERIGGINNKGSGEKDSELERRRLITEINHIKNELSQIKKMKLTQIEKRKKNEIPIVALVGYTNSGKSTTLNTILKSFNNDKEVLAKDQSFQTLQTYNRKLTINKVDFLLVDTIGFVSKIPHNLIESFYTTLEEVKNADLIIHVLDSSNEYINLELNVVLDVLSSLGAYNKDTIYLLNKWDKTISNDMTLIGHKYIKYSNVTKQGFDELITSILEYISPSTIHARLLIPYSRGDLAHTLESKALIEKKQYEEKGTYFDCEVPKNIYNLFKDYDLDNLIN